VKPLWLLDIDGVINACPASGEAPDCWKEWVRKDVVNFAGTWPILIAEEVIAFLNFVHYADLAEIRWHSTWQEESEQVALAFGLPTFEVQACPEAIRNGTVHWWKFPAVQREARERRVLWTDDDVRHHLPVIERARLRVDHGVKIICPDAWQGLTPQDLEDIEVFLKEEQ
jgi:hypothetical protein